MRPGGYKLCVKRSGACEKTTHGGLQDCTAAFFMPGISSIPLEKTVPNV